MMERRRYWVYAPVTGKFIGAVCISPQKAQAIANSGYRLVPV